MFTNWWLFLFGSTNVFVKVAVSITQISDKKLGLNNAALIFDPKQGVVG